MRAEGLAAAHAVNDGFAQAPQCHGCYHGEKVAFGTLARLVLEQGPEEELNEVLESVDLPMTLSQMGMETPDRDTLTKVVQAASVPAQSIRNLFAEIGAEDVLTAILEADRIGRAYLAQNKT